MNDFIKLRRELHAIPELALHEVKTKEKLIQYLRENTSLEVVDRGSWFYAYYEAPAGVPDEAAGKQTATIALRADFDAVCGKDGQPGHYCGHDGHAAVLACFAGRLSVIRPDKNVLLIFQPAEETGEGAVLCREILAEKNVSEIYGFHNIPGYPRHSVLLRPGTFACASTGMEITITGTPSHAAYPEAGKNPAEIIARLILNRAKYEKALGLILVTVIGAEVGSSAYGVSAGEGILRLTVRAEYEDEFRNLIREITGDAEEMAAQAGMQCSVKLIETFPATENNPACVTKAAKAAAAAGLQTITPAEPFRWSEDFGCYLQNTPGAFFGIGDGEDWPQLHTENYEFPDEIAETALRMFEALVL